MDLTRITLSWLNFTSSDFNHFWVSIPCMLKFWTQLLTVKLTDCEKFAGLFIPRCWREMVTGSDYYPNGLFIPPWREMASRSDYSPNGLFIPRFWIEMVTGSDYSPNGLFIPRWREMASRNYYPSNISKRASWNLIPKLALFSFFRTWSFEVLFVKSWGESFNFTSSLESSKLLL